jgi:RNA polymerase sigma-B factor
VLVSADGLDLPDTGRRQATLRMPQSVPAATPVWCSMHWALPERERAILLLRFFGGLAQTEIAAQVGISQMHVSRLLSRTLTQLRRQLITD